nr:4-oxalomesaconate tautomerase [Parasphingorhabdus marina]
MWMRGGTSKGGFFLKDDLPDDPKERDAILLRIMGSPDPRQIDGMGGGDPLTSKVAIVSKSDRPDVDIDYLFLQVFVDEAIVSDTQNCGNMLAAVGPFAIERGLVAAGDPETGIVIHMNNSGRTAKATIQTPGGAITYSGTTQIDGVPGSAAPVALEFRDTTGSMCGALLPTGNAIDRVDDIECTLMDNGMPCIILRATDIGIIGYESREELDANDALKARIEAIRLQAGPMMKLGDVRDKSVPKIMLVAPARDGGAISVRSFIPHRAHAGIGVLGAVTVATACLTSGSVAADLAAISPGTQKTITVEHPSGETSCLLTVDEHGEIKSSAILRTARKLFDGRVFVG